MSELFLGVIVLPSLVDLFSDCELDMEQDDMRKALLIKQETLILFLFANS